MDNQAIVQALLEIKEEQGRQSGKLDAISRAVNGNGQPGLRQDVDRLQADHDRYQGMAWLAIGLGGSALGLKIISWVSAILGSH